MATQGDMEEGLESHARQGRAQHEAGDDRQFFRAGAKRGRSTGPNPTDRARNGAKRHVIANSSGLPLAATVTGANAHDSTAALRLVDSIPPIRHGVGSLEEGLSS